MKPKVGRFVVALAAFGLWLGWLIYLALTWSRPAVLSQPQFLVADCTVIAAIDSAPGSVTEVTVQESFGPRSGQRSFAPPAPGTRIQVSHLSTALVQQANPKERRGWERPGVYILPLIRNADGQSYRVAPLPPSPGFTFPEAPLIYLADDTARRQLPEHVGARAE